MVIILGNLCFQAWIPNRQTPRGLQMGKWPATLMRMRQPSVTRNPRRPIGSGTSTGARCRTIVTRAYCASLRVSFYTTRVSPFLLLPLHILPFPPSPPVASLFLPHPFKKSPLIGWLRICRFCNVVSMGGDDHLPSRQPAQVAHLSVYSLKKWPLKTALSKQTYKGSAVRQITLVSGAFCAMRSSMNGQAFSLSTQFRKSSSHCIVSWNSKVSVIWKGLKVLFCNTFFRSDCRWITKLH